MINQYGDISQRTAQFAIVEFLDNVDPVIVLGKFGQNRPAPKNKSETIVFRRAVPFAPATVPLAEGVTPTGHAMTFEDVPVTLKQFGDVVLITDKVQDLSEDPVLKVAMEESGKQAAATVEQITYGVVKAGTSVFYANGASRAAVNTAISLNKQRAVTRYLKRQKAKKITKILGGSVNYATKPVEAAFVGICHTDCEPDIRAMSGFKNVAEYGQRQPMSEYELGSVEEVRYITSPDLAPFPDAGGAAGGSVLSTSGTSADVYPVLILGQDAFGVVPLKGQSSMTPTVLNPGTPSKSDPLGQRGYVGWKTWFNAVRLNETWMSRLEVAATNL
jgi:N4-gp56 family major capsid protein